MDKTYYTYCIRVSNRDRVLVEMRDADRQDLGRPDGVFRYQEKLQQMEPLLKIARDNSLDDAKKAEALGEVLFDVLFDDALVYKFVEFYNEVVHQKKQLLRVELDIDERQMPEVAALPWEFLRVPTRANLGTIWMGTVPNLVFYRRRSQWIAAQPIQLKRDERLKIALVVSAPPDLPDVAYDRVQQTLEELAGEQVNRIELLPIVNSANPEEIDAILSKKPHIFHFIGHGRLIKKGDREVGEIALVDPDFDEAMWVDADYFSGLFGRHRPSVVMLQACEGGKLSESQAFTGVASGIIQQKIPVVVAMQYEVTNSTASRFARRFYQGLAEYKPVDIAAQEGRLAITLASTQYRRRDFATPVIFMGVEDGYLFKNREASGLTDLLLKNREFGNSDRENSSDLNFSAIPPESIQQAYRKAFAPDADLWEENDISQILERLKENKCEGAFYQLLNKDENIAMEMRKKIEKEAKKHPEENKPRQAENFFDEKRESYLIATLQRADDEFRLNGWLVIGDSKDYLGYVNNCKSLLTHNQAESGIKCQLDRVESLLDNFIEQCFNFLPKDHQLIIEVFLPIHLLDTKVEWWNFTEFDYKKRPIGTKYSVRLRSVERLDIRYLDRHSYRWKEKWDWVKSVLEKQAILEHFGYFDSAKDRDFTEAYLINQLDDKIGIKLMSCPPEHKRQELFMAIMKSALPIALWSRYSLDNREIEQFFNLQRLCSLCDSIKKKRLEAFAEPNEVLKNKHLGSHLAVIWENPYRLTPDLMELMLPGQ